jgi:serine/threonine protein kinase
MGVYSVDVDFSGEHPTLAGNRVNLRPFSDRECQALLLADGLAPHLHGIHEAADEVRHLVMEWVEGVDLSQAADILHEHLAFAIPSVVRTYAVLHSKGVLHGDVRANNLVFHITRGIVPIDFGRACSAGHDPIDSPPYRTIAPEVIFGDLYTAAAEQFALASVLAETLWNVSGEAPKGLLATLYDPITTKGPETFPAEAWMIIRRMGSQKPSNRFESLFEAAAALRKCLE